MRQPTDHRAHTDAFTAAPSAPLIGLEDPARHDRTLRFDNLARDFQTEPVKKAEGREIRRSEGSVRHVEVFQTASVGTSILEDLDTYPRNATPTTRTPHLHPQLR